MNYRFYSSYIERLFYYFKRLFILLVLGQLICVIVLEDDTVLTKIFFIALGCILLISFLLEYIMRKTFPKVEIADNKIAIQVGRDSFSFTPSRVVKVYCNVAFSINHLPLSYDKGVIFNTDTHQIKLYLNKLSVSKVTTIQSLVEFYNLQLAENKNITHNPILIKNDSLRPIAAICIGIIIAFWSFVGYLITQQGVYTDKVLLCAGMCLTMIIPVLLAHLNSLIKIEYKGRLYLTTLLGKRIELTSRDILRIDTRRTNRVGDSRVHYLNIYLRNGKRVKYKILLSTDEDKVRFHELSKHLMEKNTDSSQQQKAQ